MWTVEKHVHADLGLYKIMDGTWPVETNLAHDQALSIVTRHNESFRALHYNRPTLWAFLFGWTKWVKERTGER